MQSGCAQRTMKLPLLRGTIYHEPFRVSRAGGSVGDVGQVFIQSLDPGMRPGWSHAELFKEQVNPGRRWETFLGN